MHFDLFLVYHIENQWGLTTMVGAEGGYQETFSTTSILGANFPHIVVIVESQFCGRVLNESLLDEAESEEVPRMRYR